MLRQASVHQTCANFQKSFCVLQKTKLLNEIFIAKFYVYMVSKTEKKSVVPFCWRPSSLFLAVKP
jgi:hypothetical protein